MRAQRRESFVRTADGWPVTDINIRNRRRVSAWIATISLGLAVIVAALFLFGCGVYVEPPHVIVGEPPPVVIVVPNPQPRGRVVIVTPQQRPVVYIWPPAPNQAPTVEVIWYSLNESSQAPRIEWRADACKSDVVHQTIHAWQDFHGRPDPNHERQEDWDRVSEISSALEAEDY